MSIRDFYLKFVAGGERERLFVALRKLSLLEDPHLVFATTSSLEPGGWPIWDGSPAVAGSGS